MDADFWEQMNPRFLTPDTEQSHKTPSDDPYPSVPSELKSRAQWVVWLYHLKAGDDKPSKMLYQTDGWAASTSNPKTWTTYSLALACYQKHTAGQRFEYRYRSKGKEPYQHLKCNLAGIGYVFTEEDEYTGIDLDDCIIDRKVQPWAIEIIDKFKRSAYTEVSPSGKGIKIWTRAKLPPEAKNKVYLRGNTGAAIEAYDSVRYFTVTGQGKYAIGDGQDAVDWLVAKYLKKDTPSPSPARPPVKDTRDTSKIKQLIENSRQRAKFRALMQGNWEGQGYGSHSEADMGLISLLCFWTQDTRHLDAIFRQSGLYREKWDEKHRSDGATYGEMTIEKALSQSRETWTPHPSKKRKQREGFYQARAKRRRYGYQR